MEIKSGISPGVVYLKNKLATKRIRVLKRYVFYEMKHIAGDFGISTPPSLQNYFSVLGWCAKAVDSMADRLVFREFKNDNFGMNEIFRMNNPDTLTDSAILSAMIASCSFISISGDEDGFPRLEVIDGGNATGRIDTITGLLKDGYAVLERDDNGNVVRDAYYEPYRTTYSERGEPVQVYTHDVAYPLLVPIIHRPDAARPFGHSRISRACMSIADAAMRTVKRAEISAEFYSFPQKYVVGLSPDAEQMDSWKAAMSAMMSITADEDGSKPQIGQFQAQSMTPHTEMLRMFASEFAGETGLTLDDLGFATENPSSAEAIKAGHENLRLAARKAQRSIGTGLLNTGYLAACLRDGYTYKRSAVYMTTPRFDPIFEPDAAMISGIGDGAIKLNQAIPGYFTSDNLRELTGVEPGGSV